MANTDMDEIGFDILIRPRDGYREVSVKTLDQARPDPEDIEKCRRWLAAKGCTCYDTGFGLACTAPHHLFEKIFSVHLEPVKNSAAGTQWRLATEPEPPTEIAGYIEQITLSQPPELF